MKFPVIKVIHNRLKYQSKSGYSPVYLSIHFNGKTDYLRLPVPKVHKKNWIGDAINGRWIRNEPELDEIISNELTKIRKHCTDEVLAGRSISVSDIKNYFGNPEKLESFNNFAKDFVRNINRNKHEDEKLAYRTVQAYRSFLVKLDDFNPDIKFEQIGPELLSEFNDFLSTTHNLKKTSRAKHFDKFNVIYDEAARKQLLEFLPGIFKGYKGRNKPQQVMLDMDEIRRFLASKLTDPTDEFFRKVFCIQLLTGLYYSDLRALEVGNFHSTTFTEHGHKITKHYLEGKRIKNGERFVIPLLSQTVELLNDISNLNHVEGHNSSLFSELLSDQKYNQRLKKIAKSLGIHKNISNKTGRHSYGVMMVGAGNSRAKVGASMGHTKEDTTRVYSKLSIEETLRGWIEPDL